MYLTTYSLLVGNRANCTASTLDSDFDLASYKNNTILSVYMGLQGYLRDMIMVILTGSKPIRPKRFSLQRFGMKVLFLLQ
jgi:hypothetical protein